MVVIWWLGGAKVRVSKSQDGLGKRGNMLITKQWMEWESLFYSHVPELIRETISHLRVRLRDQDAQRNVSHGFLLGASESFSKHVSKGSY